MAIAAMPLDTAATRPATPSAIIRSPTEEPYNAEVDMSFGDFLDMINPLHHIPIVGTIYRAVTGDTIKPASQVIGGIAFGGPIGGVASIFSTVIAQANGKSIEDEMMTAMGISSEEPAAVAVAQAEPAQPAPLPQAAPAAPAAAVAVAAAPAVLPASTQAHTAPAPRSAEVAASPIGAHRPSKMPARDTVLASTVQAKQAVAMHPKPAAQPVAATPAATSPATSANANIAVQPEMISDVMMRNLAKYEAAKKALNPTTPSIRVAG
ncbi:MAG TPA: hypothetical protein VD978_00220 [Azospirillum sp.]|nr:hypothetical protein [Azospirillum sp.]